jgi:hypothetical protein
MIWRQTVVWQYADSTKITAYSNQHRTVSIRRVQANAKLKTTLSYSAAMTNQRVYIMWFNDKIDSTAN